MLYHAKLTGSTSEIEEADITTLRTWVALVSPSAMDLIDWQKVGTGAKTSTKLNDNHSIVIVSDSPPAKKQVTHEETEETETTETTETKTTVKK